MSCTISTALALSTASTPSAASHSKPRHGGVRKMPKFNAAYCVLSGLPVIVLCILYFVFRNRRNITTLPQTTWMREQRWEWTRGLGGSSTLPAGGEKGERWRRATPGRDAASSGQNIWQITARR